MTSQAWVPVQLVGVRAADDETVVLLLDGVAGLLVPILVGRSEAAAIAAAQAGLVPPRPMTHDLLRSVIDTLGARVERVEIVRLEHGVFFAELVFADGTRVDSRASDAIALALRARCPILCASGVLHTAGVTVQVSSAQDDLEEFREFLEDVKAADFDTAPDQSPHEE
ncbi:MAG: bifunctional nuclease family protein [Micrococcales bacterium]|nr:bifunctional nuclease family protein [Micrococcales bacterium]MCL2666815.1 bifunctional nuclease family protein [Micrococcales bacterium]